MRFIFILFCKCLICLPCLAQDRDYYLTTISIISDIIRKEGKTSHYLTLRGWAYHRIDSLDRALDDYKEAILLDPKNDDLFFRRGDVEFDKKQYRASLSSYSAAIELCPDSLKYYVSRGVTYEYMSRYSEALTDYNYVLRHEPKNEFALRNRAILQCFKMHNFKIGIEDWNMLILNYPTVGNYFDRGWALMNHKDYQLAIMDFSRAIDIDPGDSRYFAFRGYCLGNIGRIEEAMDDFLAAMVLNPKNGFSYKLRAEILFKLKKIDEACGDLLKAQELGINVDDLRKKCKM